MGEGEAGIKRDGAFQKFDGLGGGACLMRQQSDQAHGARMAGVKF